MDSTLNASHCFKPSSGYAAWEPISTGPIGMRRLCFKPSSGNAAWEPHAGRPARCLIAWFQALQRARGLGALHRLGKCAIHRKFQALKRVRGLGAARDLTDIHRYHSFKPSSGYATCWPREAVNAVVRQQVFQALKRERGLRAVFPHTNRRLCLRSFKPSSGYVAWEPLVVDHDIVAEKNGFKPSSGYAACEPHRETLCIWP